ncbi:hypothetical protein D3C76_1383780 [compost metagenome]
MRESRRIDDDEVHTLAARGMDAVDQFVLRVALQVLQVMAGLAGAALQVLVDLVEGDRAVDAGLAGSQQVQVRTVQNQ